MNYRVIQFGLVAVPAFLIILSMSILPNISMNSQSRFENEYNQDLARIEKARVTKNHQAILALIDSIEKNWVSRDTDLYANLMLKLANGAANSGESSLIRYQDAEKIALMALEKFDQISLDTIAELLLYLQAEPKYSVGSTNSEAWAKQRRAKAILWLRAWQRIEDGIDKNFNPNDLPQINILPPSQTGLPAGVAPEAIKDLGLRREYEAAIAKNNQKAEKHRYQYRLRKIKEWFPDNIQRFLANSYSQAPSRIDELSRLLSLYVVEKNVRERILNQISERKK